MEQEEKEIVMQPVSGSSRVSALGHDEESQRLRAEFPNGRVAEYTGVSEAVFQQVMGAGSVGGAFGALIVNGGYPFKYV